mmetsp:Transcript_8304/g.28607  ORF Transcript_8304/g.28607 Transcript_8304/m.28607 type:complete len:319 (+) Transcript_8304:411-1367(+)
MGLSRWQRRFSLECATLQSTYAAAALGPAKWEVLLNCGADRVLAQATGWATRLGVDHRKAQKKLRGNVSAAQEARQSVSGKLGASESAAQRELLALERAAGDAEVAAKVEVEHLDAHLANRMRELQHHKDAQARLQRAFDFAGELLDKQTVLQKELADGLRTSLASIRDKLAVHEEEPRRPDWEGNEAAFERDELAEFASSNLTELKERVAEDEKELELMHEHAALTIEHAKVKKMLLADKDHELQEYEYQWGVAKANVAAGDGELMVVDEEVAVLRGLALQLTRFHAAAGRNGKLPPEVMRALTREQKDIVDSFLDV